jgi:hypothetical protein
MAFQLGMSSRGVTKIKGSIVRFILIILSLGCFLAGALSLPGLWTAERDLGILSEQSLQENGGEKLNALTADDRNALVRREMDVLRNQPLNPDALRNLALLSLLPPSSESSAPLILNLSRYSLRNPAMQMAALGVLLEAKDLPETIYRVDAVLRSEPDLKSQLYPLIAQNFLEQSGVAALTKVLATDPPWRPGFLIFLAGQPGYETLCLELIRSLRTSASPIKANELKFIFATWIKNSKTYSRSYFVWLDQLSTEELRLAKSVYDGEFTTEPKGLYFDWTVGSSRNGRSSLVLKPGSSTDRAMLVDFVGNKDPFQNVFQYLQLTPGEYNLAFEAMSKNLVAETGLVWRVSCIGTSGNLAESQAVKNSVSWTRFNTVFKVPDSMCETQLLRLETKARSGLDTSINGQVYFDSVAISPTVVGTAQ